jgi:hypothetical protein
MNDPIWLIYYAKTAGEDYIDAPGREVLDALREAFLAGAEWAAGKNEGWATPQAAAEAFTRWAGL